MLNHYRKKKTESSNFQFYPFSPLYSGLEYHKQMANHNMSFQQSFKPIELRSNFADPKADWQVAVIAYHSLINFNLICQWCESGNGVKVVIILTYPCPWTIFPFNPSAHDTWWRRRRRRWWWWWLWWWWKGDVYVLKNVNVLKKAFFSSFICATRRLWADSSWRESIRALV